MAKKWYILHIYSGHENKVSRYIENNIKKKDFGSCIGDIKIPTETVVELKNGKKQQSKKKFFPGYILIEMDMPEETEKWKNLCNSIVRVQSVTGFVGVTTTKEKPQPITKKEAQEILQRMGEIKTPSTFIQKIPFIPGEAVKVKDGPFSNFSGTIENINQEKGKVRIRVEIFGRSTPIELDFYQVESL